MDFAPTYLVQRFLYRILDFFHHWYVDGSRAIGHAFIGTLEKLDRSFAVKVTFKYFFHPLYRDYTIVGRIVGVFFRTFRIAAGAIIYLLVAALFFFFYLIWLILPAYILAYAIKYL